MLPRNVFLCLFCEKHREIVRTDEILSGKIVTNFLKISWQYRYVFVVREALKIDATQYNVSNYAWKIFCLTVVMVIVVCVSCERSARNSNDPMKY